MFKTSFLSPGNNVPFLYQNIRHGGLHSDKQRRETNSVLLSGTVLERISWLLSVILVRLGPSTRAYVKQTYYNTFL